MLDFFKKSWAELKKGPPGTRFQQRYERKNPGGRRKPRNTAMLALGWVVLAVGLFFLPAPGPGIPIVVVGAGLMAQGSRTFARLLDWCELRIRATAQWARGIWKNGGAASRTGIVLGGVVLAAAGGLGAWWFLFQR